MKALKVLTILLLMICSGCSLPEDETMANEPIFFVNQSNSDVYCEFFYGGKFIEHGECYAQTMLKVDKPIPLDCVVKIVVYNLADVEDYKKGTVAQPTSIAEIEMTVVMLRDKDMIVKYPFAE